LAIVNPRERELPIVGPRAVRVILAASGREAVAAIVVEPPAIPVSAPDAEAGVVLVDGAPIRVRLARLDPTHGVLESLQDGRLLRTRVSFLSLERPAGRRSGPLRREVVIDGWSIEVEIESERRASLRERASRGDETAARSGPTLVRAIIPGRIVAVSVVPGDRVAAGEPMLVVEAMKMQNELRAPRDGIVSSVAAAMGATIEVGDLLLALE
jgi:biotin carboxyl carrier protein